MYQDMGWQLGIYVPCFCLVIVYSFISAVFIFGCFCMDSTVSVPNVFRSSSVSERLTLLLAVMLVVCVIPLVVHKILS